MSQDLLDLTCVRVGDKLTRVLYDQLSEARVVRVIQHAIVCDVEVADGVDCMVFNRETGVNVNGYRFGYIVNKPIRNDPTLLPELRDELMVCLSRSLHSDTRRAIGESMGM